MVTCGLAVLVCGLPVRAEVFGGIDFPDGASSFADAVIQWDASHSGGAVPTEPNAIIPGDTLGPPDFPPGGSVGDAGALALGSGGLLEVLFTDNLLTTSGDASHDLHIFEVGPDVEDTFVAIRPTADTLLLLNPAGDANNDGFFEIGKVFGSTSSIDIDSVFVGFGAGQLRFDAVQLIDDPNEGNTTGSTVGADIDAVGAIASTEMIPEPGIVLMWGGTAVLTLARRRLRVRVHPNQSPNVVHRKITSRKRKIVDSPSRSLVTWLQMDQTPKRLTPSATEAQGRKWGQGGRR
jgi:hypothetical protein